MKVAMQPLPYPCRIPPESCAYIFIRHLHNQFAHVLNLTTGPDQTAEQLHFTALSAAAVMRILFTIHLTAMQAVRQLVNSAAHISIRQNRPANVF